MRKLPAAFIAKALITINLIFGYFIGMTFANTTLEE
jgi:hypothetical protein